MLPDSELTDVGPESRSHIRHIPIIYWETGRGILYTTADGHRTKSINQDSALYTLCHRSVQSPLSAERMLSISVARSLQYILAWQLAAYYVALALQYLGPMTSVIIQSVGIKRWRKFSKPGSASPTERPYITLISIFTQVALSHTLSYIT